MSKTSCCHLAGFLALLQAHADPPQRDMPDDHPPDPDDTADFELPDQQALIDAFTAGLCPVIAKNETVQRRGGTPGRAAPSRAQCPGRSSLARRPARLPTARRGVASADEPGCCAQDAAPGTALPGPVRRRAKKYKWTANELIATINSIKSTDFKVEDVNVDLHKHVAAAIAKGHFTSHNMRESDLDGDQDLTLWLCSLEDVLRELLGDDILTYDRHMIDISQNGKQHIP
jgi:hypothetical protein